MLWTIVRKVDDFWVILITSCKAIFLFSQTMFKHTRHLNKCSGEHWKGLFSYVIHTTSCMAVSRYPIGLLKIEEIEEFECDSFIHASDAFMSLHDVNRHALLFWESTVWKRVSANARGMWFITWCGLFSFNISAFSFNSSLCRLVSRNKG